MADTMSIMECIEICDTIANYNPVDPSEFDVDNSAYHAFPLCERIDRRNCVESFRIGEMSAGYRNVYVRTDTDCNRPTEAPTKKTTETYEIVKPEPEQNDSVSEIDDVEFGNGDSKTENNDSKAENNDDNVRNDDPKPENDENNPEEAGVVLGHDGDDNSASTVTASIFLSMASSLGFIHLL